MPAKYEYVGVKMKLLEQIGKGEYRQGDKLPTEREMCEIYGVSRITIRQALSELEKDGAIRRIQGRGTFVSGGKVNAPSAKKERKYEQLLSSIYSFSEDLRKQGVVPGTRVLVLSHIIAQAPLTEKLQVEPGHMVDVLLRLRMADDLPYAYETSYVPAEYLNGATTDEIVQLGLYNTMEKRSGIRPTNATEVFEAAIAPEIVAEALGRKGLLSVMQIERTAFYGDKIVEYCTSSIAGDKYRFRVKLG